MNAGFVSLSTGENVLTTLVAWPPKAGPQHRHPGFFCRVTVLWQECTPCAPERVEKRALDATRLEQQPPLGDEGPRVELVCGAAERVEAGRQWV